MFGVTAAVISPFRSVSRIRHDVVGTTLVIDCVDARYAEAQFHYCCHQLRLGRFKRDWQLVSVAGGAAAFAHFEKKPTYFGVVAENLGIVIRHFPTFKNIIVIGHHGCNFAIAAHRNDPLPSPEFCWAREDCHRVALAFRNRANTDCCPIGEAIRGFTGDARVIFTGIKPGTRDVPMFEDFTRMIA